LLLARSVVAQTTDPVRQKLDAIFVNLDKSQVPNGRLLEAAVPLELAATIYKNLLLLKHSITNLFLYS